MANKEGSTTSWLGNVCQKFEANVCQQFEAMCEEVKFVGDSVKKLYSDVMEELLLPSSDDPINQENPDLVHNADVGVNEESAKDGSEDYDLASKLDVKEDLLPPSSEDPVNQENPVLVPHGNLAAVDKSVKGESEEVSQHFSLGSKLFESCNPSNLFEFPSQESHVVNPHDLHEMQSSSTDELSTCCNGQSEVDFHPSATSILKETPINDTVGTLSNSLSKSGNRTTGEGNMSNATDETPQSIALDEFGNEKDMSKISDVWDEIDITDDNKAALQAKKKLEESSVLVDKSETLSSAHLQRKKRSYRKKIRDVLHLGRWSSRKKQEQLNNALRGDTDSSSNSIESGWEII